MIALDKKNFKKNHEDDLVLIGSTRLWVNLSSYLNLIESKTIQKKYNSLVQALDQQVIYVVFESVVVIVFQSVFRSEMYENNVFFYFLKFNFDINT